MPCLSSGSELGLGSSELVRGLVSDPQNIPNDISQSATSVGTQDLDSDEVDSLSNTLLAGTDSTGAVGAMVVVILVDVILMDGGSSGGATFKLDMSGVDLGIDDVRVNTLITNRVVFVESESSEAKPFMVGDAGKTLGDGVITNNATRVRFSNVPTEEIAKCQRREQWNPVQRKRPLAPPDMLNESVKRLA